MFLTVFLFNFRLFLLLLWCYVLLCAGDELNCKFEYFQSHYSCSVQDFVGTNDYIMIQKVTGHHLDGKTDDDVESLFFEDQNVPFLPHGIDQRFINLKFLTAKNSSVVHINNEALKMNNLLELTFEYNNIKDIAENTFHNLGHLQSLNLASNHIAELHLNTFKNMMELRTLNLNWNQLELLEAGVFNDCKNLQTLMLRQNKLKFIDKSILDPLVSLQYVYLQGNVCVNRNDYNDFIELKAEIASKCTDVCAKRVQKITDEFNVKLTELQLEAYRANEKIKQLSAEAPEIHKELNNRQQLNTDDSEDISIFITPDNPNNNLPDNFVVQIKDQDSKNINYKIPDDKADTYLSFKFTTD
ncbi:unnamed protein product [Diamesa serratosioi]